MQSMKILMTLLCASMNTQGLGQEAPQTIHAAKDLGVFGETFVIEEKNLLAHIQEKLQAMQESGALDRHQQILQEKAKETLTHPQPVAGIVHTKTPRTFTYDPSIVVPHDLKDHKGKVFYPKGTRVNPLAFKSLTKPLLFIDGEAKDHEAWLVKQLKETPQAKVILVKGDPFERMKTFTNLTIFYDQGGALVRKLGIQQVPARVVQVGDVLQITEDLPDA